MPRPYRTAPHLPRGYLGRATAQRKAQRRAALAHSLLAVALPLLACGLAYLLLAPIAQGIGNALATALALPH